MGGEEERGSRLWEFEADSVLSVCRYGPDVVLSGAHVPDLVIFLDPQSQHHVLREVNLMKIPSMGQSSNS